MCDVLNEVELELKKLYDSWECGNQYEAKADEYSTMFRMGYPEEFINSKKPLLMYIGKECRDCKPYKTQEWVRKYQWIQLHETEIKGFSEKVRFFPYWRFYRDLAALGYNVLWNNLDKFHKNTKAVSEQPLSIEHTVSLNQPFGKRNMSILQREIELIHPNVIVLAIGKGTYIDSLAAALSIDRHALSVLQPTGGKPVQDISDIANIPNTKVLWTYHPGFLCRNKNRYNEALVSIKEKLLPTDRYTEQ